MKSYRLRAAVDLHYNLARWKWMLRLASRTRTGAIKRGIDFDLTLDYAEKLFLRQHGRCAVTGIPFHMQRFPDAFVKYPFAIAFFPAAATHKTMRASSAQRSISV